MTRLRIMLVNYPQPRDCKIEMSIINMQSGDEWLVTQYTPSKDRMDLDMQEYIMKQARLLQQVIGAEDIIWSSGASEVIKVNTSYQTIELVPISSFSSE